MDQAWNTPKLQYRSSNVLGLISHANQLSFWVASMILLPQKADDRAKIVDKFVKVADVILTIPIFFSY